MQYSAPNQSTFFIYKKQTNRHKKSKVADYIEERLLQPQGDKPLPSTLAWVVSGFDRV